MVTKEEHIMPTGSPTKDTLARRAQLIRQGELEQRRAFEADPDDDPRDHDLLDHETVFAEDETGHTPLDKLFR